MTDEEWNESKWNPIHCEALDAQTTQESKQMRKRANIKIKREQSRNSRTVLKSAQVEELVELEDVPQMLVNQPFNSSSENNKVTVQIP